MNPVYSKIKAIGIVYFANYIDFSAEVSTMDEIYAKFIRTEEISFKHAKGMRDIFGKEMHPYHEIFLFMGGDAEFISETGKETLMPDTIVIIPKETFHQFVVWGPEKEYRRCVFNFDSVSELNELIACRMDRIRLIQNPELTKLFGKLRNLAEKTPVQPETDILMKALFAQILVGIPTEDENRDSGSSAFHEITGKVLALINEDIAADLSVAGLATVLHISVSQLSHVFKKDLHISVHKYILEKRLILANKKIRSGISATQAAAECGFHDYSGFYRQYRKMFGFSPADSR